MTWLQKLLRPKIKRAEGAKSIPEGLWCKCQACEALLYSSDLETNQGVCPKCRHHHRLRARQRLDLMLDPEGRIEIGSKVISVDPLKFKDSKLYPDRLAAAKGDTGESDALLVMMGAIKTTPVVIACFEFNFMGGSMGSVVGERFVRGVNCAIEKQIPFICVTSSGGARMQEGLFSLMQMAKTAAAVSLLAQHRLPFITLLTDPTTGGVSASFAFLGDVVIAEPYALIGFAGPRVIAETVREVLPEGFQRSEFLLEKGAIDMIVDRSELRDKLASLLCLLLRVPVVP